MEQQALIRRCPDVLEVWRLSKSDKRASEPIHTVMNSTWATEGRPCSLLLLSRLWLSKYAHSGSSRLRAMEALQRKIKFRRQWQLSVLWWPCSTWLGLTRKSLGTAVKLSQVTGMVHQDFLHCLSWRRWGVQHSTQIFTQDLKSLLAL